MKPLPPLTRQQRLELEMLKKYVAEVEKNGLPWADPEHDVIADVRKFLALCEQEYRYLPESPS